MPVANFIRSAASETENPRRNIAKAVRRVFYRILIFYVILCIFKIVRWSSRRLCIDARYLHHRPYRPL